MDEDYDEATCYECMEYFETDDMTWTNSGWLCDGCKEIAE